MNRLTVSSNGELFAHNARVALLPRNTLFVQTGETCFSAEELHQQLKSLSTTVQALQTQIDDLKTQIDDLKTELRYRPGGEGFQQAFQQFTACQTHLTRKSEAQTSATHTDNHTDSVENTTDSLEND